ncbi:MAG: 3-phosphoserine/phosphohydroxythreonine transaminase [Saprospiraceae bacterium]
MKKHNFNPGPAVLPLPVLQEASQAILDYNGTGLSILEISHRGSDFVAIIEEAIKLSRDLLGLSDEYHVLFTTGGASTQFFMLAQNLLNEGDIAAYSDTGTWANKAIKEAKACGSIKVVNSSKDKNYSFIPKDFSGIPADARFLHVTSNNTIYGSQIHQWPEVNIPIVCDMSSDIFSRPIEVEKFGLIYAGAQKNLGPAGVTMVILRKDMVRTDLKHHMPPMLDYKTYIAENSLYNTPPVFPIYVCMLTLRWLKQLGGLKAMEEINQAKGKLLYDEIDANPFFKGTVAVEDRSLMNVCFVCDNETLENEFALDAKNAGCINLKGHRSVGGFRASIYNALPIESVQVLVDTMKEFARKKG